MGDTARVHGGGQKLNIAIVLLLLVGVGLFFIGVADDTATDVVDGADVRNGPPMLAVLPFTTKNREGDGEFFAVGVHDDLLTQLAQLQSIRVISRTSVLEYKDTVRNIREIGKVLGADAILEGGVQSSGNNIRINAQLIDARTDEHLWAQTYDRELTPANIFAVQTEIAHAITTAMKATLSDNDAERLALIPTENMAAYRAYHRAVEMRTKQSRWQHAEYRKALEEAVRLDPEFTRAWADLVGHLSFANFFFEIETESDSIKRAEEAIETIRKVAPGSADYLMAQSYYAYYALKDYDLAYQFIERAQEIMPSDIGILELKSWIQRRQGDLTGRAGTVKQILLLDPRNISYTASLINILLSTHSYAAAQQELEATSLDSTALQYMRQLLQLRKSGEFQAWAEYAASYHLHADNPRPMDTWMAQIQNRDYEAATTLFDQMEGPEDLADKNVPFLSARTIAQLVTYWLQQDEDNLAEIAADAREFLTGQQNADGSFERFYPYLELALVNAIDGDVQAAERHIQRFLRSSKTTDYAAYVNNRDSACQTLAIAGATTATVNCLRQAFVEPSYVYPFLEPHLPFYDGIRDEPEFVELLADLDEYSNGF